MYPLARNQYINNLPGIFSCIRAGANTGATCIRTEMKSLKNLSNMRKMIPQKYFPVFARVRIQAPHAFAQKLIPQEFILHVLVLCRGVCTLAFSHANYVPLHFRMQIQEVWGTFVLQMCHPKPANPLHTASEGPTGRRKRASDRSARANMFLHLAGGFGGISGPYALPPPQPELSLRASLESPDPQNPW